MSVPPGTRCLMADVAGVGRDFPLSMEKLSPILAFYVVDGVTGRCALSGNFALWRLWATRRDFTRARAKRR